MWIVRCGVVELAVDLTDQRVVDVLPQVWPGGQDDLVVLQRSTLVPNVGDQGGERQRARRCNRRPAFELDGRDIAALSPEPALVREPGFPKCGYVVHVLDSSCSL